VKPPGYYAQTRADLVELLPRPLGRVLDVGCAEGGAAAPLREAGAERLVGVEIHAPSAERARAVYDEVHTGSAQDVVPGLAGPFDTILLYDTLEHIPEPDPLLRALAAVAAPGARLHVSVPNARHWALLRDLAVRGTFGYAEAGHRDATHLRWFTRRDLGAALEAAGWSVQSVTHGPLRPVSRLAERLTRGLSPEFLVYQWAALAVREVGG
jgi:2-polyprenyl-3-methyl-5-hydroxy-6-metoxy-1,4-benzoquinol methylase